MYKEPLVLIMLIGCFSPIFGQAEGSHLADHGEASPGEQRDFENVNVLDIFDRTGSAKIHGDNVVTIHPGSPLSSTKFLSLTKIGTAPPPLSTVITPVKLVSSLQEPVIDSPLVRSNAEGILHSCDKTDHSIPAPKEDTETEVPAVTAYFAAQCRMLVDDPKAEWTVQYALIPPEVEDDDIDNKTFTKTDTEIEILDSETSITLDCDGRAGLWKSKVKFVVKKTGRRRPVTIYDNTTTANLCD